MPENRHLRFLLRLLYAALALAGLWLALRFLLPWLLPFLLAFGLAALLEPAVRLLMERLHLPRRGAAALCTAALTAAVLGGLALVVWRVGYELSLLLGRLPTLLAGLPTLADGLERWAYRFLIALPVQFQTLARDALEGLLEQGIALPNRFYDALAGAVTGLASALPAAALFLFTTVLATYFTSAGRPALLDGLRRRLPPPWRTRLGRVAGGLREALGCWLKAQGLLMLITFGELAAGGAVPPSGRTCGSGGRPAGLRYRHRTAALGSARPVGGRRADERGPACALLRYLSRAKPAGAPSGGGAGGAPSPGCPGLHVCGLSGARSSWNASRPTGRRAGPAALGFRPPAQPVRTLSKQPAAHAAGCLFLYFVPSAGI